jgi:hypothetical protein
MKVSTLELIRLERTVLPGEQKQQRAFWDFCIDGISLYNKLANVRDLVSIIWIDPPNPVENRKGIKRLLMLESADFPNNRTALYVCPECGDLGCGAISIGIIFSENQVTWKAFGYENNYENIVESDRYTSIGPFVFDRIAYENLFRNLLIEY